jgi:hypothetical protein
MGGLSLLLLQGIYLLSRNGMTQRWGVSCGRAGVGAAAWPVLVPVRPAVLLPGPWSLAPPLVCFWFVFGLFFPLFRFVFGLFFVPFLARFFGFPWVIWSSFWVIRSSFSLLFALFCGILCVRVGGFSRPAGGRFPRCALFRFCSVGSVGSAGWRFRGLCPGGGWGGSWGLLWLLFLGRFLRLGRSPWWLPASAPPFPGAVPALPVLSASCGPGSPGRVGSGWPALFGAPGSLVGARRSVPAPAPCWSAGLARVRSAVSPRFSRSVWAPPPAGVGGGVWGGSPGWAFGPGRVVLFLLVSFVAGVRCSGRFAGWVLPAFAPGRLRPARRLGGVSCLFLLSFAWSLGSFAWSPSPPLPLAPLPRSLSSVPVGSPARLRFPALRSVPGLPALWSLPRLLALGAAWWSSSVRLARWGVAPLSWPPLGPALALCPGCGPLALALAPPRPLLPPLLLLPFPPSSPPSALSAPPRPRLWSARRLALSCAASPPLAWLALWSGGWPSFRSLALAGSLALLPSAAWPAGLACLPSSSSRLVSSPSLPLPPFALSARPLCAVPLVGPLALAWPAWWCPVVSRRSLPGPRSLAFSAFRAGGLRSLVVRRSLRSFSGFVVVASFGSASAAGAFGRRWAGRLGRSVAVRRLGSFFAVSVPCAVSPRSAACCSWVVARLSFVGGLRRLVWLLSLSSAWSGVSCG